MLILNFKQTIVSCNNKSRYTFLHYVDTSARHLKVPHAYCTSNMLSKSQAHHPAHHKYAVSPLLEQLQCTKHLHAYRDYYNKETAKGGVVGRCADATCIEIHNY